MRINGFADEDMQEVYEPNALARALRDARARTLAMYAHLDEAALAVPYVEIVNPPLWELSHLAWFQEFWCLRHSPDDIAGTRIDSIARDADRRFNSAIAAHRDRWEIARMPRAEALGYLEQTLERCLEALPAAPPWRRYFYELSLLHEDMHGEALLMTLQTLGLPSPAIDVGTLPTAAGDGRDVHFEGGTFLQGTPATSPFFAFDNERPAFEVRVEPFSIADRPVTQAEFARFVVDTAAPAPRYWKREGDAWIVRRFDRWVPLEPEAPMVHVTLHEAQAYCRWAGRRLPTESEWEFAAVHDAGDGNLQLLRGAVWQWTATPFAPYEGFVAGPYREYSAPWFHTHQVLRGGSFATRPRLVHDRWRNFYQPHRNDVFAGFRTCALEP